MVMSQELKNFPNVFRSLWGHIHNITVLCTLCIQYVNRKTLHRRQGPVVKLTRLRYSSICLHIKKRLLPRCIHHFKSDLIHNMDHMRISGTEPSSVVLSQRRNFKSWKDVPNVPKQAEAKRDGVINPQNYNLKQFYHGKFWCSQTKRINRSRP